MVDVLLLFLFLLFLFLLLFLFCCCFCFCCFYCCSCGCFIFCCCCFFIMLRCSMLQAPYLQVVQNVPHTHPPSHPPTFPPSSIFLLPAFHFSTTAFPPPHPSPLPVLISQLPPPPCSYRVVNEYKCRNDDELTLTRGDVIKVVEKCRDGWWVGVSMETGNMGIFPGNHVALI